MRRVDEIKKLRKRYGLTQKQLAEKSGVSQSLIAKIEAGLLDPSYTKAQQIFDALHDVEEKNEVKAKDIMHRKVVFCKISDYLRDIIHVMRKRGISQIPVQSREKIVGIITENTILRELAEHPEKIGSLRAGDVMEDVPPIVSLTMGMKTIVELLRDYSVVLVAEKGDIKGIISKVDLFERIS